MTFFGCIVLSNAWHALVMQSSIALCPYLPPSIFVIQGIRYRKYSKTAIYDEKKCWINSSKNSLEIPHRLRVIYGLKNENDLFEWY